MFGGTGVLIGVSLTILWTFRPIIKLFRKMPMDRGDVLFILHMPVAKRMGCNDIHFMTGELGAERRCQLPKPARGAEASTAAFMLRGAAQAELTEGAERSLEFAEKSMSNRWSSRRLHRIAFQGRRCGQERECDATARNRGVSDGKALDNQYCGSPSASGEQCLHLTSIAYSKASGCER